MEELNLNYDTLTNDENQHEAEENYEMDDSHLSVDTAKHRIQIININNPETNLHEASCETSEGKIDDRNIKERREDDDSISQDRQLSVIEKDDYKYIGQILNEVRDGFGICYYKDKKFIGQWKNDLKRGYGKLIMENGDIMQGELLNDTFEGYCECMSACDKTFTKGTFIDGKFTDIIIIKNDQRIYEGEAINISHPDSLNVSFGKLYSAKRPEKFFYGEVLNYKEEYGYGLFVKKTSSIYLGEMRKKTFLNYIEMYYLDRSCFFTLIDKGLKSGMSFSYDKKTKVSFGKYKDDYKNGPFVYYSNCHNLQKSSIKMELYHNGFKSKVTDKLESSKKYLHLNYPEYEDIFRFDYEGFITKFNSVIAEDFPFYLNLMKGTTLKKIKENPKTVS